MAPAGKMGAMKRGSWFSGWWWRMGTRAQRINAIGKVLAMRAARLLSLTIPVLWLILALFAAALWIRGYKVEDDIHWGTTNKSDTVARWFSLNSSRGEMGFAWDRLAFDKAVDHFARASETFPDGRRL